MSKDKQLSAKDRLDLRSAKFDTNQKELIYIPNKVELGCMEQLSWTIILGIKATNSKGKHIERDQVPDTVVYHTSSVCLPQDSVVKQKK